MSLTPAASKALARAKFELFARFDLQVSQSDILQVLILRYARDFEELRRLLQERQKREDQE